MDKDPPADEDCVLDSFESPGSPDKTEVLTHDEIDQLLTAISAGEVKPLEVQHAPDQKKIKIYDFKRPDKFSTDQMRTVSIMHETFARLTTTSLSAQLRSLVHVHVASVDRLTHQDFIRSIPNPATLAVINMDPLRGSAILQIDPALTFSIIDRLFGGQGEGAKFQRELTAIEQSVMEGIIMGLLRNLVEAWSTVIDLRPRLGQIETNPQFARIVPPTEMVVLVTLETKVGEVEGMMNFCIPYLTIEPIISRLSAQQWYSAGTKGRRIQPRTVGSLRVEAKFCVATEKLTIRTLSELKKRSLIKLPDLDNGNAYLAVRDTPLGRLTVRAGKRREWQLSVATSKHIPEHPLSTLDGERLEVLQTQVDSMRREIEAVADTVHREVSNEGVSSSYRRNSPEEAEPEGPASPAEQAPNSSRPFDFMCAADAECLSGVLRQEHPQTAALILTYVAPELAAQVLSTLGSEEQVGVLERIATMDRVAPDTMNRAHTALERIVRTARADLRSPLHSAAPVEAAARILNQMGEREAKAVIGSLQESDAQIAESIRALMSAANHDSNAKDDR